MQISSKIFNPMLTVGFNYLRCSTKVGTNSFTNGIRLFSKNNQDNNPENQDKSSVFESLFKEKDDEVEKRVESMMRDYRDF